MEAANSKSPKKIIITGAESSGKSTLAAALAAHFGVPQVPEYARIFFEQRNSTDYCENDLLQIAQGQTNLEAQIAATFPEAPFIICDTDLITIKIWSDDKYGHCHPWIEEQLHSDPQNLYLLCVPDLPWHYDPLRENPHNHSEIYALYEAHLQSRHLNYVRISGSGNTRTTAAIRAVEQQLQLWQK
ncbi:MAG: ATP-binding protein [Sphingobacteriales bacterium]|nr:ATP-binding protein [Sphingobacteriales bacterium]